MLSLMQTIEALFPGLKKELYLNDASCYLTAWKRSEGNESSNDEHRLFLCKNESVCHGKNQLWTVDDLHKAKQQISEQELAADKRNLLLLETTDLCFVEEALRSHFAKQLEIASYAYLLFDHQVLGSDLQMVIDNSYAFFGNPIYVFDENFNLLAANWAEISKQENLQPFHGAAPLSEDWMFEMLNRNNHIHKRVMKSELPILSDNQYLGFDQLYCAIDAKKDRGHITISAVNKPIRDQDYEFMLLLKKYVRQQLQKDIHPERPWEDNTVFFLRDILSKRITGRGFLPPTLEEAVQKFQGEMTVLVIETERSERYVNEMRILSSISNEFSDAVSFSYNGHLVVLLRPAKETGLSAEEKTFLADLFIKECLYAGVSLCFRDIFALPDYYEQALRSIELGAEGKNEPGLFAYEDYYMGHLKHIFLQNTSAEVFCHPTMQTLFAYDAKNRTELAFTYYMYLRNGKNYVLTGKEMHLHRTTIAYRLKKIAELTGPEPEDATQILHMILSYEMCK